MFREPEIKGRKMSVSIECVDVVCEDTFERREETSSGGGTGQTGSFEDPDDCADACREEEDCVAFDWTLDEDADVRCWLHFDMDVIDDADIGGDSSADQYVRQDCEGTVNFIPILCHQWPTYNHFQNVIFGKG